MWIATPIGFFSVVKNALVKGEVLIRARCKADIWNLYRNYSTAYKAKGKRYQMTRPKSDATRDYMWRISMKQRAWAAISYKLSMAIDYTNFKSEVHRHPDQDNKSSAYMTVWSALHKVQMAENKTEYPGKQTIFHWPDPDWTTSGELTEAERAELNDDLSNGRWDLPPEPTKTIRTTSWERHEL
jgi:hypothetical protein